MTGGAGTAAGFAAIVVVLFGPGVLTGTETTHGRTDRRIRRLHGNMAVGATLSGAGNAAITTLLTR